MIKKTIADVDAGQQLDRILDEVAGEGSHYIIEQHGEPAAAVVPFYLYQQWERAREDFFDRIEEVAKRVNMDEDEAMALALEAQQAVRAERRQAGV